MNSPIDLTAILLAARRGDQRATDQLFELVYAELHEIARSQRRRWEGNETINTTALVHEAYIKLVRQQDADWECRAHFFAVAAKAMRHILISYSERQIAAKRGGGAVHLPLDDEQIVAPDAAEELLALDDALQRLARVHKRSSLVVECRFFGGFNIQETAQTLGVSHSTVERDWAFACAWLQRALTGVVPEAS